MKVHLGSGANILEGWVNLDMLRHPGVTYHDLRNPLPFQNDSVDFFFSEHFFEHLAKSDGLKLLGEIKRCLKPGGVSRITVPDLDILVDCYNKKNLKYYGDGWLPASDCDMMNEGMREWGHQYMYNINELINVHKIIGFSKVEECQHKKSKISELHNLEFRGWTSEIVVEAVK